MQDLEPVLRDPDKMIAMVKNGIRGFIIGHDLSPGTLKLSVWKMEDLTQGMEIGTNFGLSYLIFRLIISFTLNCGFAMLQASLFTRLSFDPFSVQ